MSSFSEDKKEFFDELESAYSHVADNFDSYKLNLLSISENGIEIPLDLAITEIENYRRKI
jgi:hypothetical protein